MEAATFPERESQTMRNLAIAVSLLIILAWLVCVVGCARPLKMPTLCQAPDINVGDRCVSPQLAKDAR